MLSFDWVIHVFTYQIKKGKCFNIYIYTVYLNLTLGQTLKSMLKSYFFLSRWGKGCSHEKRKLHQNVTRTRVMEPRKRNMRNRQGAIVGEEDRNFLGSAHTYDYGPRWNNRGKNSWRTSSWKSSLLGMTQFPLRPEQQLSIVLAFEASFCGFYQPRASVAFLSNFAQIIGLENFNLCEFLEYNIYQSFEDDNLSLDNVSQAYSFVLLELRVSN